MNPTVMSESSDIDLLNQFVNERSEAAFTAIVRRHGRMVQGVCERLLADRTSAEDAYQATFLVLATKAASLRRRLRPGTSLGAWLNRVAHNSSIQIGRSDTARSKRERVAGMRSIGPPEDRERSEEVLRTLEEEMQALPEKFRAPLVLHYLEDRTQQETADELGLTLGTLRRRLDRARFLLRGRLVRRGVAVSVLALGEMLRECSASLAPIPAHSFGAVIAWKSATTRGGPGLDFVPGIPAPALAAGKAVVRRMGLRKMARAIGLVAAPVLLLLATILLAPRAAGTSPPPVAPAARAKVTAALPREVAPVPRPAPSILPSRPGSPPARQPAARPSTSPGLAAAPAVTSDPGPPAKPPEIPAARPAPPRFSAEIQVNGQLMRFDNEADFERVRRQLASGGGMTPSLRSPGYGTTSSGTFFFSVHVEQPGRCCCCQNQKGPCCLPGSAARPAGCKCRLCPAFPTSKSKP